MGYSIKNISEINTFDFSQCSGYSTIDTVRKSNDGLFFLVSGDLFNDFTYEQILEEMKSTKWNQTSIIVCSTF